MIYRLVVVLAALVFGGCTALPGGTVVDSAMVVHSTGSSRGTISVRVPLDSNRVYSALDGVLAEQDDVESISRNERSKMLDVVGEFGEITVQVTPLGARESLLYVWVDAGGTGRTGNSVAIRAVSAICEELNVNCQQIEY